ncbi:E3 ubiquitin-protein ligase listerin [Liparis tanakae]|uniref:E3 ubiquitin-protein ligase listerin n=1 Tax=Liparis tanakae TaxID=230148 RepID=A0A4Z2GC82_9TELE|nr:E3 ubiquitin-protein ligase listerin [Liparis tanakae]
MRCPDKAKRNVAKKKSVKIRFSKPEIDETPGVEDEGAESPGQAAPEGGKASGSLRTQHFEDVVCQLARLCLAHVDEKHSERHLTLVELEDQTPAGKQGDEAAAKNPAMRFLMERAVAWLAETGREDTEHLVEMLFSSLCCCSPQETTRILNHVTTMDLQWRIILQIIQRACTDPETLASCRAWLQGSVLGERLLGLTEELCRVGGGPPSSTSPTSNHSWTLISLVLSRHHDNATAEQLNFAVEMMRFLSWLVTHCPRVLGGSQWDFLLCSMLAWLETASENVSSLWNPWVQLFVCENAAAIVKLNRFFTSSPLDVREALPSELVTEWTCFFVEGIYNLLFPLPVNIIGEPSVGAALACVPLQQLKQNSLPPRFIADQKTNLPEPLQTLLNTFCPLLLFKARPLQITVYHVLEK